MPQMSPMSWMLIYLYFIIMFIMFIMKIYFNKKYIIKNNNKINENFQNNWKW